MSVLRRFLSATVLLDLFLVNFALGAVFFVLKDKLPSFFPLILLFLSFVSVCFLVYFKIHLPLNKVIQEMKALLTGRTYRRIMTSKRDEIGVLAHFFNEITRNLESISGDVRSNERIKKELNAAQNIQKDLLPSEAPRIAGLEICAKTRPASEIGGDSFDFYFNKNRTFLYVGDSTGHGIPAGIVMVMVDTLIETFIDLYSSVTEILVQLNKYLKPHLQTTMFMTLVLLEWIPERQTFKWAGAGHEYLVHAKTSTGEVNAYPCGGVALGMIADNSKHVKENEITMNPLDFLVLYSDGITEAKNVMGETYGLERLQNAIKTHMSTDMAAKDLFDHIALDVSHFMAGSVQDDDMTLIVIKHVVSNPEEKMEAHLEPVDPAAF